MPSALQSVDLASWQEHFDFLLPRKELLRPDEVATALGCDTRTVLRLFEEGKIHGFDLNAATEQRMHRKIRRASVILLLARRANYAPSDLRDRLLEVLAILPRSDQALLHSALGRLITQG